MSISLKIKGNKRGNEGVGVDLVAIGDPRFPVIDQQYPGVGSTTDFIVARHLIDKSVYTIVTKNVTPCDSNRAGVMMVSLAIPAGEHVVGLFNLLIELSGFYKSNYMTYDGSTYHFTADIETADAFADILSRYQVVKYPYRHVKMTDEPNSVAYLYLKPAEIAEILDDPMRDEFAGYGQVVMVPVADPAAFKSTFPITPAIVRAYRIFVNGRQTAQTVSDPAKPISITIPENKDYEAASVRFTLGDARQGLVDCVVADDIAQVIHVKLQPKKKVTPVVADPKRPEPKPVARKRKTAPAMIAIYAALAVAAVALVCWLLGVFGGQPKQLDTVEETIENLEENLIPGEGEGEDDPRGSESENPKLNEEEGFGDIEIPEETESEKEEKLKAQTEQQLKDDNAGDTRQSKPSTPPVKPSTPPAKPSTPPAKPSTPPAGGQTRGQESTDPATDDIAAYISTLKKAVFTKSDFDNIVAAAKNIEGTEQQKKELDGLIDIHKRLIDNINSSVPLDHASLNAYALLFSNKGITKVASKLSQLVKEDQAELDAYQKGFKNRYRGNRQPIY